MNTIRNPVLPGFHPDPSIVRVGDDYYLATSTFEWFPGVALFHSRDLAHWRPIGHVMTRRAQLDLPGVGDSGGLWAPSISFDGERFYCVVCHVRTRTGPFKDMRVMLVTADAIDGPWGDPILLGGGGFDPSLFHDPATGCKWLANIQWDPRTDAATRFAGIVVQEYDATARRLIGAPTTVLAKPQLCEGPNLYRRDGWYYLMLAEGGTGWNHGIAMARSRDVLGPYELDPQPLVLTSRTSPGNALQKAGHGELVETAAGEPYLVHLASRVHYPERRALLGREACVQRVEWSPDGWLRLAHGGSDPRVDVPAPASLAPHPWTAEPTRDAFDAASLGPRWQSLRVPIDASWCDVGGGRLRMRGRESVASLFEQSLVARRIESTRCAATTRVTFAPTHFTQAAGLIVYYDTRQHFYLRITRHETLGRIVELAQSDDGAYAELHATRVSIDAWGDVFLRATIDAPTLRFAISPDGEAWHDVGGALDFTKLSDDYGGTLRFTGPMVGVCCQDLNAATAVADFHFFDLRKTR